MIVEIDPVELFFSIVKRSDVEVLDYDLYDWDTSTSNDIIMFDVRLKSIDKRYRIRISKKWWNNYMSITDVGSYIDDYYNIDNIVMSINRQQHKEIVKYIKGVVKHLDLYKECDKNIATYNVVMKLKSTLEE